MVKISNVTQRAKERLERTFNNSKDLKFTGFEADGEILFTLDTSCVLCKCYSHDSSIALYHGGKVEILECEDYGELRFC